MPRTSRCFPLVVAAMLLGAPALADPPDKARCLRAYEDGQALRVDHKLRAAREEMLLCGSPSCPSAMQPECLKWLAEVDAETPTIVIRAHLEGGGDAGDVRVLVDGEEVQTGSAGAPLALDPGQHRLRFERPGTEPLTQTIVARTGEKLRPIDVTLGAPPGPTPPPPIPSSSPAPEPPTSTVVWPGYLFGGAAAVGVVAFSYFGLTGVLRYEKLKRDCAPACSPEDSEDVRRKLVLADVSLAVSAVAFAGAAYFLWWKPSSGNSQKTSNAAGFEWTIAPTPGGGLGLMSGSF